MKKLLITFLAVLYLGVSSGATVHFHYCMGQLIEWGLTESNTDQCSSCGRPESETDKCCKDQSQQFKVEKSQKAGLSAYEFNLPQLDLFFASFIEPQQILSSSQIEEHFPGIQPPRTQTIPAFIRNCNFRI